MEAGITEIILAVVATVTAAIAAAEAYIIRKLGKLRKWVRRIGDTVGEPEDDENGGPGPQPPPTLPPRQ